MLANLHVKNLGIVAEAEVDFGPGLNIITGETGAGKSLLIDALSVIRGARFATTLIGPFGDSSSVTATFQIPPDHKVLERLTKWGLEDTLHDHSLVIRRVCSSSGRTKNYVNDVPVHLRSVVELAADLVDISSQFANQRLLDERSHLNYLDAFAATLSLRAQFETAFQSALECMAELATLRRRRSELLREKAILEAEISDLDAFEPTEQDYQETKAELARIERWNRLMMEFSTLSAKLTESPGGCLAHLSQIERRMQQLSTSYPQEIPSELQEQASRAKLEAEELSFHLESLATQWGSRSGSREEQHHLEQRLNRYLELSSRFGVSIGDLESYAQSARQRLLELAGLEDRSRELVATSQMRILQAVQLAETLSADRAKVIKGLAKLVEQELAALGMPKARFLVEMVPHEGITPILLPYQETLESLKNEGRPETLAFERLSRSGFERARFLIAPNPGSEGGALRETASGGELSRLMLSIKAVLFEDQTMSVFVFDEIDTGISGQVASKVGQKLAEFCGTRQAIVVTHLPQVACFGGRHYIVTKATRKGQTMTQIVQADQDLREQEIAKMMSGSKVTGESIAQARILLKEAQRLPGGGAPSKGRSGSAKGTAREAER